MKNFLALVIGILIGAALMHIYNSDDTKEVVAQKAKPKGLITPAEAKVLDQAYNIKHQIINDSLFKKSTDGGDNRSSWYSLEDVEAYIEIAKNEASGLGYTMDGIRVYLGSYPDSKDQTGYTTMFLIPTGTPNESNGSFLSLPQGGSNDIPGGSGLNKGQNGVPPGSNYPQ